MAYISLLFVFESPKVVLSTETAINKQFIACILFILLFHKQVTVILEYLNRTFFAHGWLLHFNSMCQISKQLENVFIW